MKKIYFHIPLLFICFCAIPLFLFANTPKGYYSQYGQDKYVYETFFKDQPSGTFVEIGAYDGIILSNTYFFEKELGWKGLCIEPNPYRFQDLLQNRNCYSVEGAIGKKRGSLEFCCIKGGPEMLSGLVSEYDPRHVQWINREVRAARAKKEFFPVEVYPLVDLLLEIQINHVDFLSLDTEGGELLILKAIDFNRVSIDVITVENNYGTKEIEKFLTSCGYKKVRNLGCDEVYAHRRKLESQ
ncbi:MAG: FkbM family methyltransferase [Simkaniaceae bacterium]|nr:FkbM family methyltransferase [Simkaniaceae bacterium]